jgi:hypothetical protein
VLAKVARSTPSALAAAQESPAVTNKQLLKGTLQRDFSKISGFNLKQFLLIQLDETRNGFDFFLEYSTSYSYS